MLWADPMRRTSRSARKKASPIGRGSLYIEQADGLVHTGPGLAAAEHAAESAALNTQRVRAFQCDRGIIGAAGVRIENPSAPFGVLAGLHVDQDLLAILVRLLVHRITAEIAAALLDADLALLLLGQPHAKRRIGHLRWRRRSRLGDRRNRSKGGRGG